MPATPQPVNLAHPVDFLTPWYPPGTNPKRPGVYITQAIAPARGFIPHERAVVWYTYWDGKLWGWSALSPEKANKKRAKAYLPSTAIQTRRWRGLRQETRL